jgi:hypothetical protein
MTQAQHMQHKRRIDAIENGLASMLGRKTQHRRSCKLSLTVEVFEACGAQVSSLTYNLRVIYIEFLRVLVFSKLIMSAVCE